LNGRSFSRRRGTALIGDRRFEFSADATAFHEVGEFTPKEGERQQAARERFRLLRQACGLYFPEVAARTAATTAKAFVISKRNVTKFLSGFPLLGSGAREKYCNSLQHVPKETITVQNNVKENPDCLSSPIPFSS
jgi:hypothetical protein